MAPPERGWESQGATHRMQRLAQCWMSFGWHTMVPQVSHRQFIPVCSTWVRGATGRGRCWVIPQLSLLRHL